MPGRPCPKPAQREEFVPALGEGPLNWLAQELGPADRKALREICEEGDVLLIEGQPYILAPLSDTALEALAAFECEGDDLEDFNEDHCQADEEGSLGQPEISRWLADAELDECDLEPSLAGVNSHGAGFGHYSDAERRGEVDLEDGRI